jgi:penicillin-binding protein 2
LVRRTLRHPVRGGRVHPKPPARRSRRPQWRSIASGPRMRPRRGVKVSSLVGSPEDEQSRPNLRLRVLGLVVIVLFAVLVLRLWTLQVIDAKSFAAAVTRNQIRVVSVPAPRGEIVDRANTALVTNTPEQVILLSRAEKLLDPGIIGKVAALVGETPQQVDAAVSDLRYNPYEPVPVAYNVPPATVLALQTNPVEYPGVSVETLTQRAYPQGGSIATPVLGYVNDISSTYLKDHPNEGYTQGSLVGVTGVEQQYESYLRGVSGRQALSVNVKGQVVGTVSRTAPQVGGTVVLNVDAGLQQAAQNYLQQQILADRQTRDQQDGGRYPPAINGAVIVMDPRNGQVLAMASYPTYDVSSWVGGISTAQYDALKVGCNNNNDSSGCPLINYAMEGQYTPGSTFKLVTATAALQDGVISPNTYYNDTGSFKIPGCPAPGVTQDTGCTLSDNPGDGTGLYNVSSALTVSSDSFFYNLGYLFWNGRGSYGNNAIQNVAAQYGEGQITGIDLPFEGQGRVDSYDTRAALHTASPKGFPNPPSWFTGDNIEMAFGQGQTVLTPLEQAVAYATFANGGTRYVPEVASKVVDPVTGKVVKSFAPVAAGHVSISPTTYNAILSGLEGVISNRNGTAYGDFIGFPASWNLAGKTGTATNSSSNKFKEPNSWFVAFGPNPNPQYLVLAVIDQGGYGAQAAAPLVRNIFNYLVANPVNPVVTPTPAQQPTLTTPTTNPAFGTPTTTTTKPGTKTTTTTGAGTPATTTTTAPPATTTTVTVPATTTTSSVPGGP